MATPDPHLFPQPSAPSRPGSTAADRSTVVDLPDGSTVTLAGLSGRRIGADAQQLGHLLFG